MGCLFGELLCVASVGVRCECEELLFFVGWERERVEEGVEDVRCECLSTCECFELFVGCIELQAAHDGLDGFREDFPSLIEILLKALCMGFDFAESFLEGGKSDQGMGQGNAAVSERSGVCEIALPTGDREFLCEVFKECVGDAQVSFGIFKVDGVDFVGHGGGTDFALDGALAEVAEGDVSPEVTGQIDQDGVGTCDGMEQFGDPVVGFDLRGVGIPCQAKGKHKGFGDLCPVGVWVGDVVRVVIAYSPIDLAVYWGVLDALISVAEAFCKVGDLFSEGGGGGGLSVCARKHRECGVLVCEIGECAVEGLQVREKDVVSGFLEHQGVGEVVDIFGGTGKMQEFLVGMERGLGLEAFFEEVFDGFDIVVGGLFDVFDAKGVLWGEVEKDIIEEGFVLFGEWRKFGDLRMFGKMLKPTDLDQDAVADQSVFA